MREPTKRAVVTHRMFETGSFGSLAVLMVIALLPYRHFVGDDAYITLRFARNLADGGGYSFNYGVPTYGSTSPLWVILLAGLRRLGIDLVVAAHLLDWLFVLLLLGAFWQLCREYLRQPMLRLAAGALLVLDPWFIRWAMSGMESPAALFFLCMAFLGRLWTRRSLRAAWIAPLCCGLGLLTRPEFVVVTLLVLLDTLLFEQRARLLRTVASGLAALAIAAPWFIYAQLSFGSVVPNTVTAKIGAGRVIAVVQTLKFFASAYIFEAAGLVLCVAIAGRWLVARLRNPAVHSPWFLPIAWTLALPSFYVAGSAPVAGRYLLLGLPAYLLVGVKSWDILLSISRRIVLSRLVVGAFIALSAVLVLTVQYHYCWYITRWPEGMDPRMIDLGRYLDTHTSPDDLIATDQIGTVGYFANRRILDLAGLISPEAQHYNRRGEKVLWRFVRDQSPQWLIGVQNREHLVEVEPSYASLELVGVFNVRREGASNAGLPSVYRLFRTNWPHSPGR